MAVARTGRRAVLYAANAGGRSFASQLPKCMGDIPENAKRLILADNLKRLLRPILKEKG